MKRENPRIIFFGTPEFAVASLDAIHNAGYDIVAIVTMPDKIAGRGHKLIQSPVKEWAVTHNKPILQPENLKDSAFIDELESYKADLFIVIAFRMLPVAVWSMPPMGTFNLHASLLPRYRGAAPINWAIINGETETGVTTFFLKHEIDTGDIICQERIVIEEDDDAGSLHDKLMELGAAVTLTTLEKITEGTHSPIPQEKLGEADKAAPKIFHDTCFIDWTKPAQDIANFVRGLSPYPAARSILQFPRSDKAEYKIFSVTPHCGTSSRNPRTLVVKDGKILVGCSDGVIEITSLQAPGKRRMSAKDFLNGLRLD